MKPKSVQAIVFCFAYAAAFMCIRTVAPDEGHAVGCVAAAVAVLVLACVVSVIDGGGQK
jgi:hypothetical protein